MKGQLSLEVLLVLGLVFVFLVPVLFYFFYQSMVVSQHISQEYSLQWILDMEHVIENVYYGGPGTKIVMDEILPSKIKQIQVRNSKGTYLIYVFEDGTEIVSYFPMKVVLAGSWDKLSSFKLTVENQNGTVVIKS